MKKFLLTALMLVSLAGCNAQSVQDGKTEVFTSFYAMADFASEIGKDKVNITNLSENGSMHDFEISATQMAKLSKSDLFIYCGGADHWAEDIAKTAREEGCRVVRASHEEHEHNEDAHIWLDPDLAIEQMEIICNALCSASPKDSDYFKANLASAKEKYATLKEKTKALSEKTQGKTIVVSHGAYGYLCDELGITQLSIEGIHGESDPTAAQMAQIIDYVKENNVKFIFTSPNETSKSAQSVAKETDAQILHLDSLESDNGSGGYFEVMTKNLETIEKSLGDL